MRLDGKKKPSSNSISEGVQLDEPIVLGPVVCNIDYIPGMLFAYGPNIIF